MNRVAYMLDRFPMVSETFILNEMLHIQRYGWDPYVFSLANSQDNIQHPGAETMMDRMRVISAKSRFKKIPWILLAIYKHPVFWYKAHKWALILGSDYLWIHKSYAKVALDIQRLKCKHIHIHFGGSSLRIGALLAMSSGLPFSVTLHGSDIYRRPLPDLKSLIEKSHACITVSQYNKQYLIKKMDISNSNIHVIPNGVNTEYFRPDTSVAKISGRILTVARLSKEKGFFYLVNAAAKLAEEGRDFEWVIIGEGPERVSIEKEISKHSLCNRVKLLGACSSHKVLHELRKSEVFVLTSISEGAPIVNLEAMSTGVPVIATNIRGIPEYVISGETGLLVSPRSSEEIARAVKEIFDDPKKSAEMGIKARNYIKNNFTQKIQANNLINLWT